MQHRRRCRNVPALVFCLVSLPVLSGCGYGDLPAQRGKVSAAWTEVAEQHKRRAELVALLAQSIQASPASLPAVDAARAAIAKEGEAAISSEVLPEPIALRKLRESDQRIAQAMQALLLAGQNEPSVAQSQGFGQLKSQVEGTQLRIAAAHFDYAEAARIYNTSLRTLPGLIWARILYRDHAPVETFSIAETRIVPRDTAK